jgi:hypothetical protein
MAQRLIPGGPYLNESTAGRQSNIPGGAFLHEINPPRTLTAEHGSFALNGQTATLKTGRLLSSAHGEYALGGQDATLSQPDRVLGAAAGSYSVAGQAAAFDYLVAPPAAPEPAQGVGGGRRRYFEVWKNVPIYAVETEREARKVLRVVKRKVMRQIHRAERGEAPLPELPQISTIADALPALAREVTEAERTLQAALDRAVQRAIEQDEEDVELLLL